ncbi:Lrp/AsnC family transcriptional regulator [Aestuariirhabdus litorea]|uniref:Lrp/AsnC family transcriptional regulator n=1 Tax=Aestuariirhabdus litorea TaxID=2528527 RepID=A0A3P3VNJ7_9GAMM|nr:Lrp/AsnC family transcriptional regulator [Aestuariirhabdus litorea]RRJ84275.1 Lrp/AsnC family transcriptional regulator [Aestuariirhabdus litorea]RWW97497.1 AsnC family transcriptional regulator [Endozoicomonadaceae bacterium GTF-13]
MTNFLSEELDRTDTHLLTLLQKEGRISNARAAQQLNLSEAACWRRWKRLEERGYIDHYSARVERKRLGYGVTAFVQVRFGSHGLAAAEGFEQAMKTHPQVISCHNVTGNEDYIVQVVARDLDQYAEFTTLLRGLEGVNSIQSSISLREIKRDTVLPPQRQSSAR